MNADLSNIIIFPTWHNGTTESLYKYNYIGPEGIVDTDDYFVIALELFGNRMIEEKSLSLDVNNFKNVSIVYRVKLDFFFFFNCSLRDSIVCLFSSISSPFLSTALPHFA